MQETATELDTIAAISTPAGEGGISIVRVSGNDALDVASRIFKGKIFMKLKAIRLTMDISSIQN